MTADHFTAPGILCFTATGENRDLVTLVHRYADHHSLTIHAAVAALVRAGLTTEETP